MENDDMIYDKLNYFFQTNQKVFFTLKEGFFRKGFVIDLSKKMRTVVLREDVLGEIPILFEEIQEVSIQRAKEGGS